MTVCLLLDTLKGEEICVSLTRDWRLHMKGKDMKDGEKGVSELRSEYDFDYSKAVRGKYCKQLVEEGANIAVLDPDIAEVFHDSVSVNEALRLLLDITRSTQRLRNHSI